MRTTVTLDPDAEHHRISRRWLDGALSGDDTVGLAWVALLAFVRLSTRAGPFPLTASATQAFDRVEAWLRAGSAVVVEPWAGRRGGRGPARDVLALRCRSRA